MDHGSPKKKYEEISVPTQSNDGILIFFFIFKAIRNVDVFYFSCAGLFYGPYSLLFGDHKILLFILAFYLTN